ncbi:QWRF motif-containing protein 7 [Spatholobus suberectus]|nr:QWRF motif-containing protein 7 [Spatholobus suberectus]
MDKTARTLSGSNHLTVVPPPPRLVRSRSGRTPERIRSSSSERFTKRSSLRSSSSERFTNVQRSKSTSRTRTTNIERNNNINLNPTFITSISSKPTNNMVQEKKSRDDSFGKFLQRGVSPDNNVGASKRTTSTPKPPSAWALSPGRWPLSSPIGSHLPTKVNDSAGGSAGGGVTQVLKYFKQRKVSSLQEEEYHRFKILHNRLLQWRFINARAEVVMANVKNIAEVQLFSVWRRIRMLRKITIQKRIELQKVKHGIKLYQILNGQLHLLREWAQLERRNQESVARLTRKLSALSTILPLSDAVKVDTDLSLKP